MKHPPGRSAGEDPYALTCLDATMYCRNGDIICKIKTQEGATLRLRCMARSTSASFVSDSRPTRLVSLATSIVMICSHLIMLSSGKPHSAEEIGTWKGYALDGVLMLMAATIVVELYWFPMSF